jgi:hypothetical protein
LLTLVSGSSLQRRNAKQQSAVSGRRFVPTVMDVTLAAGRSESTPHLLGEAMRHSESARVSARIQPPLIRKSRKSTLLRSADSVTQTTQWRDLAPQPHWQKRREMWRRALPEAVGKQWASGGYRSHGLCIPVTASRGGGTDRPSAVNSVEKPGRPVASKSAAGVARIERSEIRES